jgi:rhamnulokinase
LESLAFKYRWVLEKLEQLLSKRFDVIHIVGGGCQNSLLCQWTADACGVPVLAGPVEATAMGNVLVQAMGLGLIGDLPQAREVVKRSVEVVHYEPRASDLWQSQWDRYASLIALLSQLPLQAKSSKIPVSPCSSR